MYPYEQVLGQLLHDILHREAGYDPGFIYLVDLYIVIQSFNVQDIFIRDAVQFIISTNHQVTLGSLVLTEVPFITGLLQCLHKPF
ncbi:hypothetical protein D3C80_1551360 [compost metagenome]